MNGDVLKRLPQDNRCFPCASVESCLGIRVIAWQGMLLAEELASRCLSAGLWMHLLLCWRICVKFSTHGTLLTVLECVSFIVVSSASCRMRTTRPASSRTTTTLYVSYSKWGLEPTVDTAHDVSCGISVNSC